MTISRILGINSREVGKRGIFSRTVQMVTAIMNDIIAGLGNVTNYRESCNAVDIEKGLMGMQVVVQRVNGPTFK
ncbi:hypothetical protein [Dyadobacter sp. Leaf189]|uniref:hypothetical protein n=1 Tax=Dyadobacter sp. Leaf189 TaxID=1736295 RepID=UPI000701F514|nr:hypothetical protein [Dyadobacter sp. Leaf189]KQS27647.1 hypothetical protein ASG33_14500 [Dyadobacter sp. Leaf189]